MYWEHLWVRLAISTEKATGVRILETSKRLAWMAYRQPYVFEAIPAGGTVMANPGGGGMVQSSGPQSNELLAPEVWARCLDSLGSDGWELVSVTPLSGDVRGDQIYANDRYREQQGGIAALGQAGRHDVQLWVFKRERPDGMLSHEDVDEEEPEE
jgi:hypothetical protein